MTSPFYEAALGHAPDKASPSSEMDVRDRKGNRYRLHFDWNGDKKIANPKEPGTTIDSTVVVYSAGSDGDYSTWDDNLTSWER